MRCKRGMTETLYAQSFMRQISILPMADDNDRARRAFARFLKAHNLSGRGISIAAGLSSSAASQFIQGNARSPKADTMRAFARAASDLLGRPVSAAELVGEKAQAEIPAPRRPREDDEPQVPVAHYVGAGDQVILLDGDDSPVDYTPAPPGFERDKGAAVLVRGESMRPLYEPGDLLFFRHRRQPPATAKECPQRPVIVQVKDGPLYVKRLLPGTKRGRFHLISVNPLTPILQDEAVESFAMIEWVKPKEL